MNRTALKNYAPQARRAFIQAVTDRAAYYGLAPDRIEPVIQKGDVAVIGGREHPRTVAKTRRELEERIKRSGFAPTMEAMAYTWFNRLVAIRFMELHGYLEHGYRVLSHPEGKSTPEILEQAEHVALAGLKHDVVIDLKLAGNKEGELYRLLLTAQCNELHTAMPFLFERIEDETELLLPDNLLHSHSLIRKLVSEIDEQDWEQVEIIGWLYQYYISEKKDEVIGKVVVSEDIPAATQLFTPNWIVKYLVQNTLGRQWLATYPQSALRQRTEYYIEPAEQTPEVQEQLNKIRATSLNPEELTLLDPACGSGHILVEAYDLFKALYQDLGYRAKDIPALILQKNLFGLEIDHRAAQLAGFALMMKARAGDRTIFNRNVQPHVLTIQESKGLSANEITDALNRPLLKDNERSMRGPYEEVTYEQSSLMYKDHVVDGYISLDDVAQLIDLFEHGKTFGSLIQIPYPLADKCEYIARRTEQVTINGGMLEKAVAGTFFPIVRQAYLLARKYGTVVTNPPYLGSKAMPGLLKTFGQLNFPASKTDTFAMFIERCNDFTAASGYVGLVVPYVWMFLTTYTDLRSKLLVNETIQSLVQLEYNAFEPACVPVCTFTLLREHIPAYQGTFISLQDFRGSDTQAPKTLEAIRNPSCAWRYSAASADFAIVPHSPLAYWVDQAVRVLFNDFAPLKASVEKITKGIFTGENARFIRLWFEVPAVSSKWRRYSKGGAYRKWYGNSVHVVNWSDGNGELSQFDGAGLGASKYFNRPHFVWSKLTSSNISFRYDGDEVFFDDCSPAIVMDKPDFSLLACLNTPLYSFLLKIINPTLNYQAGDVQVLPRADLDVDTEAALSSNAHRCVRIAQENWDWEETSWGFSQFPLLDQSVCCETVEDSLGAHVQRLQMRMDELYQLESENTRLLRVSLGLSETACPDLKRDDVSLVMHKSEDLVRRLLSYSIGCMMGRYSLDEPGLIYAQSEGFGFDLSKYKKFPADENGIIPLTEFYWFEDVATRFETFLGTVWPKKHLEENINCVAKHLGQLQGELPRQAIRRYLATSFYRDHLRMYKGPKEPPRPIYWLFSSGKGRAFQALVYLHRYREGTLSRMRTEYVIPLQGQIAARIEQLEGDKTKATSTSHRSKLQKEQTDLKKQQAELLIFEEKLKHLADQKIALNLDDGVKANYAKFGDLLAESKAITGGKDDE